MAKNKTHLTTVNPLEFINTIESEQKRQDALEILEMMKEVSGEPPKMWGPSIIGFGQYHYTYESGHEGDICKIGFSPRKANLVLYLAPEILQSDELLTKLGKHKTSKACLYINKLADVDRGVLKELIEKSFEISQ